MCSLKAKSQPLFAVTVSGPVTGYSTDDEQSTIDLTSYKQASPYHEESNITIVHDVPALPIKATRSWGRKGERQGETGDQSTGSQGIPKGAEGSQAQVK